MALQTREPNFELHRYPAHHCYALEPREGFSFATQKIDSGARRQCSLEHAGLPTMFIRTYTTALRFVAPAKRLSASGPQRLVMAETEDKLKPIRAALEAIRERADCALKQLKALDEMQAMRWICKDCHYTKHFTEPVPLETTGRCPRCKSSSFEAVL